MNKKKNKFQNIINDLLIDLNIEEFSLKEGFLTGIMEKADDFYDLFAKEDFQNSGDFIEKLMFVLLMFNVTIIDNFQEHFEASIKKENFLKEKYLTVINKYELFTLERFEHYISNGLKELIKEGFKEMSQGYGQK